jgi:hypothetical protein
MSGAALLVLDLLNGEAKRSAKFLLGHAEHQSAHSHAAADMLIGWVWRHSDAASTRSG